MIKFKKKNNIIKINNILKQNLSIVQKGVSKYYHPNIIDHHDCEIIYKLFIL